MLVLITRHHNIFSQKIQFSLSCFAYLFGDRKEYQNRITAVRIEKEIYQNYSCSRIYSKTFFFGKALEYLISISDFSKTDKMEKCRFLSFKVKKLD